MDLHKSRRRQIPVLKIGIYPLIITLATLIFATVKQGQSADSGEEKSVSCPEAYYTTPSLSNTGEHACKTPADHWDGGCR